MRNCDAKSYLDWDLSERLAKLGFDERCECVYSGTGYGANLLTAYVVKDDGFKQNGITNSLIKEHGLRYSCAAPTLNQAYDFIREKFGIWIVIRNTEKGVRFYMEQYMNGKRVTRHIDNYYNKSYDIAMENGLEWALKKFIPKYHNHE